MIDVDPSAQVHLAIHPVDFRMAFDSLAAITQTVLKLDPLCGHLFVFHNKKRDRIKILYWQYNGFCLWYKRLEAGKYRFPKLDQETIGISREELGFLLEGIDISKIQRLPAFQPAQIY
jgi:transposase